jgi:hypothetical protein
MILPVVSYGCETWSLILGEERNLKVSENRMFRRIFGPKRDETIGGWRKLHNEELHNLYTSPNTRIIRIMKSRGMRWTVHVASMGVTMILYRILVGKPEGKRPLRRPRRKQEGNIKMDLRETGWGDLHWIHLAQDRDRCDHGNEISGSIKCWEILE